MSDTTPDPKAAADNIACGLMRLLTMPTVYGQATSGMEKLASGIEEALRYLKALGESDD